MWFNEFQVELLILVELSEKIWSFKNNSVFLPTSNVIRTGCSNVIRIGWSNVIRIGCSNVVRTGCSNGIRIGYPNVIRIGQSVSVSAIEFLMGVK